MIRSRRRATRKHEDNGLVGVLDIGASKVSCFIAEMVPDAIDGQDAEIIGVGHQAGDGLSGGLVGMAADATVRGAVDKAERMAGKGVKAWHVAVPGRYLACRRLAVDLALAGHPVIEEDLTDCYRKGASYAAAEKMRPLHIWPASYSIDDHEPVVDPRGLVGEQLTVGLVSLSASRTAMANLANCLERCRISVQSFIAAPYAAALAVLMDDEKSVGVICFDMGAARTNFTVYRNDALLYAGAVPVGSDHISRDIAQVFGLSRDAAERAKTRFGTGYCTPGDELRIVDVPESNGSSQLTVASLAEVIGPRLEEILTLVDQSIREAGLEPELFRRLTLTGGGSQMQGLCDLIENLQKRNVRVGRPLNVFGAPEAVSGTAFSVCAGMIRHLVMAQAGDDYDIPHFLAAAKAEAPTEGARLPLGSLRQAGNWLRTHF